MFDSAEQEKLAQYEINLRALLRLSPDKVYADEDLDLPETMERALRLPFYARNEQDAQHQRISPHVKYMRRPKDIADSISSKLAIEKQEVKSSLHSSKT